MDYIIYFLYFFIIFCDVYCELVPEMSLKTLGYLSYNLALERLTVAQLIIETYLISGLN